MAAAAHDAGPLKDRLGALRLPPPCRISAGFTGEGRADSAVRTTDSAVHTWDLARAIGADERLDAGLVAWIDDRLEAIYAGLTETPVSAETTHRFFAAPDGPPAHDVSRQDRLLHRMGGTPARTA